MLVVCCLLVSIWGSQFYCNGLGSSDWFWLWQKSERSWGKWNHWSLTNGDSICHRCSDWLVNSGDDIPIGKSDRPHILVVVVAYMQLLSARDALFFRNSETAKSLEIRKCNFINLICQNLTINKFHRLRVPPNQAQHNESANSVQKTSGRRKMMTILERFWQNWIILDTQLLTFMSQKWKVFVCIFPFGEYVLLCDKDILFSVELKVWTV